MTAVTLHQLSVSVAGDLVLDGIDVVIPDGAFVAVIGPSGSGKSTLLRTVAGLEKPVLGHIMFDDVDMVDTEPARRDVGFVFQSPALLPTRSVRGNVRFPLEIRRQTAEAIRERVGAEARALHIEHLFERATDKLSRGEQQMVQIARTMVRMPRLLLLDEPFAPLDDHLRQRMRDEIRILQSGYGVTTIMATNDPTDAMSLASMLIVLGGSPASIVQWGPSHDIYDEPASVDVATATGPLWQLSVSVTSDGDGFWLTSPGAVRMRAWAPALASRVGSNVTLGVRTDSLVRDARGHAEAELIRIVPGAVGGLLCRWGGRLVTGVGTASPSEVGTTIRFRIERPQTFDPATGARIT